MAFFSSRSFVPVWRLQRLYSIAPRLLELFHDERRSPSGKYLSMRDRLNCWRHGFLSESWLLYDLCRFTRKDYLSDYARYTKARMNGVYTTLLDNKVMFDAVMRPFQENIPKTYALVLNKKLHPLALDPCIRSPQDVVNWCIAGNNVVLKPLAGGGGSGIIVMTAVDGELFRNGERTSAAEATLSLQQLDRYLVQEKIEQADYARKIYPRVTNTIRVLTMLDVDTDEPFIAAAVHRFGSDKSFPVDNWTQGGLCAAIDLATGEMSKVANCPTAGRVEWCDAHPNTTERISGITIPGWPSAQEQLLKIARAFPYLRYVGWDVVLDRSGRLRILEGNHRSGVHILQVHAPLLRDPRVRKFYEHN